MVIHTTNEQKHALRTTDLQGLEDLAYRIRRNVLLQAAGKGQGYVDQELGVADIFAMVYDSVLNWRPEDLK